VVQDDDCPWGGDIVELANSYYRTLRSNFSLARDWGRGSGHTAAGLMAHNVRSDRRQDVTKPLSDRAKVEVMKSPDMKSNYLFICTSFHTSLCISQH